MSNVPDDGVLGTRHSTAARTRGPWEPGSVSMSLYRYGDAGRAVANAVLHTRIAAASGFDGVTVAEHHVGIEGYFPRPSQVAEWLLADTDIGWSGPCPLLLPLRKLGEALEELAWLEARHPGRVAAGVAAGYDVRDFDAFELPFEDRVRVFCDQLDRWSLDDGTQAARLLRSDVAIRECLRRIPTVVAAGSPRAVRAAARLGLGLFLPPASAHQRAHRLGLYADLGGRGPRVLSRWVWLGAFPAGVPDPMEALGRQFHGGGERSAGGYIPDTCVADDAEALARTLAEQYRCAEASCVSLRFFFPGVGAAHVEEQIARVGAEVLPQLRRLIGEKP